MVLPNCRRRPAQYNIENLVCSIGCVVVVAIVARAPEDPRVWSTSWSILLIGGVTALLPVPTAFNAPVPSGRGSRLWERPGKVLDSLPAVGAAGCERLRRRGRGRENR
jgi:hypothetical protein